MRILPKSLLAAAAVALAVAAPAAAHQPPTVPTAIQPPAGNTVFKALHAVGVQIYTCNGTAWTFVGPRANLYNAGGRLKMIHFAGPTWQYKDGSQVVGQVVANAPGAPGAIPWLLLAAKSTAPGPFGDKLTDTTYIQRVATAGGLAPAAATCDAAAAGTTSEVPYTADYYFWKATD